MFFSIGIKKKEGNNMKYDYTVWFPVLLKEKLDQSKSNIGFIWKE
jgi:hypothetical protein